MSSNPSFGPSESNHQTSFPTTSYQPSSYLDSQIESTTFPSRYSHSPNYGPSVISPPLLAESSVSFGSNSMGHSLVCIIAAVCVAFIFALIRLGFILKQAKIRTVPVILEGEIEDNFDKIQDASHQSVYVHRMRNGQTFTI